MPGVLNPAGNWGPPDAPYADAPDRTQHADVPDRTQLWSAQVATAAGLATQTHDEAAFDNDRLQAGDFRNADAVWLAGRILSDADDQAAEITQQASGEAVTIRAEAEREAAEIRQQAATIRKAAEREAAELRAAAMTMSADLGRVAAYITENLTIPAMPATKPAAEPATKPSARPATKLTGRPAAKPAALLAGRPAGGPPRQYAAMRLTRAVVAALLLFAVTAGTTEIALHGYSFFVFRAAGTGSTPNSGLKEDQGPGQPDAPGAHPPQAVHKR